MKLLIALTILIVITTGCFTNKKGITARYSYVLVKGNSNQPPIVTGVVTRADDGKPVASAGVKLDNEFLCAANEKGYFKCQFKPGRYRFGAIGVFMELNETKKIRINNGDTLKIDFYLFDGNEIMH